MKLKTQNKVFMRLLRQHFKLREPDAMRLVHHIYRYLFCMVINDNEQPLKYKEESRYKVKISNKLQFTLKDECLFSDWITTYIRKKIAFYLEVLLRDYNNIIVFKNVLYVENDKKYYYIVINLENKKITTKIIKCN